MIHFLLFCCLYYLGVLLLIETENEITVKIMVFWVKIKLVVNGLNIFLKDMIVNAILFLIKETYDTTLSNHISTMSFTYVPKEMVSPSNCFQLPAVKSFLTTINMVLFNNYFPLLFWPFILKDGWTRNVFF